MFVFLRSFGATLVGVIGIPICTIAAFLGLLAAGRTVNVISLGGRGLCRWHDPGQQHCRAGGDRAGARREGNGPHGRRPGRRAPGLAGGAGLDHDHGAGVLRRFSSFNRKPRQLYSDVAVAISASILASMLVAISVVPPASVPG